MRSIYLTPSQNQVVMDSAVPDMTAKDHALRAIGLNLVSLQRLEKILKWLAGMRPIACKLPEITVELERRRRSTEQSTLGTVIPLWLETARGQEPTAPTLATDLDVLVSYWLQLRIPQHVLDEHAKELDQILTERNWFVHNGLAEIDFDSNEACGNLIARLDEQDQRVIKQIEFLRHIGNRILELNQFVFRDDVQETLKSEMLSSENSKS